MKNASKTVVGNLKGKDHSEDLSVDGKVVFEWIFEKLGGKIWM
jgi:hypothetical protein